MYTVPTCTCTLYLHVHVHCIYIYYAYIYTLLNLLYIHCIVCDVFINVFGLLLTTTNCLNWLLFLQSLFIYASRLADRCAHDANDGVCDPSCNTDECPIDTVDCGGQLYVSCTS